MQQNKTTPRPSPFADDVSKMTRTDYQFTKPLAGKPLTSPFGDYASARLEKMRKEQEEF